MMPEAAAVIAAARGVDEYRSWPTSGQMMEALSALSKALEALDAKVATIGAAPSKVEQDRTWGEVVAGDEILSTKTGKWYEVRTSVRVDEGKMKVIIKGNARFISRGTAEPVRLKRGVNGEAVDILEVLFSGQTVPTHTLITKDVGPMLKTTKEEEESDDE